MRGARRSQGRMARVLHRARGAACPCRCDTTEGRRVLKCRVPGVALGASPLADPWKPQHAALRRELKPNVRGLSTPHENRFSTSSASSHCDLCVLFPSRLRDLRVPCTSRSMHFAFHARGVLFPYSLNFRTATVSFCPPKPKEFERQRSTPPAEFRSRALFGT